MIYADAHADIIYEVDKLGVDLNRGGRTGHFCAERVVRSGLKLQICSLWTPARLSGFDAEDFGLQLFDTFDRVTSIATGRFKRLEHPFQLDTEAATTWMIPWLEGASPLRGSFDVYELFKRRGLKGIGLTWNHANEVADGCGVREPRNGLSEFGVELIRRMEADHIIVDCAHLPEPAFQQVVELTTRPFIVSHTGMRSLVPMTRNVSDSMARDIADKGGFVGIDYYPGHLVPDHGQPLSRRGSLDDLAKHVKHAIGVCGEDHVGLGGDLDGFGDTLEGLEDVADVANIPQALERCGLGSEQIEKVMGKNLVRVLSELW